jgi:hypothetical protein
MSANIQKLCNFPDIVLPSRTILYLPFRTVKAVLNNCLKILHQIHPKQKSIFGLHFVSDADFTHADIR